MPGEAPSWASPVPAVASTLSAQAPESGLRSVVSDSSSAGISLRLRALGRVCVGSRCSDVCSFSGPSKLHR